MRPRISATCWSACSWVIFSFLTCDPVWIFETSSALVRPWSTNFWSMSLRTTEMPAELITWAISPPIVPAPTTAALVTNMAARLQRCLVRSLRGKPPQSAFQSHRERAADEEDVGQAAQRATARELVVELHDDGPDVEPERLPAAQLILEDLGREDPVVALDDTLGHVSATGRCALPDDLRADLGPGVGNLDHVPEAVD